MKISAFKRIVGGIRIFFGFCPECNSDAPEVDSCPVCDRYRSIGVGMEFPPSAARKALWWERFTQSRCTHGFPMSVPCQECLKWIHRHNSRPTGKPRRG